MPKKKMAEENQGDEITDEVGDEIVEAARAKAAKDNAQAQEAETNTAANVVAAATTAAALAKEETARATQQAAAEIDATKGEIAWLKQQAEALGLSMTELAKRLEASEAMNAKLRTELEEHRQSIRQQSMPKEPEKEKPVDPKKEENEGEDDQEEAGTKKKTSRKPKSKSRWI